VLSPEFYWNYRRKDLRPSTASNSQYGVTGADVLRLVLLQGMWLTGIGLALGLAFALGLTRTISRLLYGIGANDPVTVASVVMLLGTMSLLACYFPAQRAMRRNPVTATREL
jgi:ABC-type antimicrobial peptide transport system permease subunit